MANNTMRIRLKAYEHRILDDSAKKIVEAATKHGAKKVVGPVPLPTEKQVVTFYVLFINTKIHVNSLKFVRISV